MDPLGLHVVPLTFFVRPRPVGSVLILSHATTIKVKYQAMLHVGPVSQTCAIIDIDREFIRTGDRATVAFRFVQRPEYLAVGDRLLFREGRTKGLGIVTSIGYDGQKPLNHDLALSRPSSSTDHPPSDPPNPPNPPSLPSSSAA